MPRMPTYEELENRITELEEEVANNRLIEEELIRSEEKYKALFEGVSEGILVADIGTKEFKYANPAICKMLGYSEEELKQLSVYDIHPKEVLDYLISQFEDQARGENTLATNIPCVARDRSIIYADIGTAKVLIDGHEYNIGLFTDITERKRAEEALRRSQQEFRLIAENVPGLFSYLNSNGRYRFVNKNYEEWFNLPSTEIIGKHYREVLGVTTYDVIKDRVKAALSGQRVCYEDALPYKHGGTRWVFVEYVPDIDDGG
jgi:PAS domain S-box-containing protein